MNKAILFGNVGKDPEVKTFDGKKKASFSLATTRSFKDKDGNRVTDWHNIVAWGSTAELMEKFVRKGSSIIVEGEIQYRNYIDKEGVNKHITEINCNQIHFAGKKESNRTSLDAASNTVASREESVEFVADKTDDLPF